MTDAETKANDAIELHKRMVKRMGVQFHDQLLRFVPMFLVAIEEMQKMQNERRVS